VDRFALIGFGAIAEEMVRCIDALGELPALAGVLVRRERQAQVAGRFAVVSDVDALMKLEPRVVAECAGHGAVSEFGAPVLERGANFLCASVGALAAPGLAARLAAAAKAGAQILIPSGAIAGIDGLLAARTAGLQRVTYTSIKPPVAWQGMPADRRELFFEGSAREAALRYPQNANVGATVAFAGLGLDRTVVRLVSDPQASGPLGIIEAEGDFGRMRFEILAYASRNPKTSTLTAHSMVMALRQGMAFALAPQDR
jgi:aspartate dehydrogenase